MKTVVGKRNLNAVSRFPCSVVLGVWRRREAGGSSRAILLTDPFRCSPTGEAALPAIDGAGCGALYLQLGLAAACPQEGFGVEPALHTSNLPDIGLTQDYLQASRWRHLGPCRKT